MNLHGLASIGPTVTLDILQNLNLTSLLMIRIGKRVFSGAQQISRAFLTVPVTTLAVMLQTIFWEADLGSINMHINWTLILNIVLMSLMAGHWNLLSALSFRK